MSKAVMPYTWFARLPVLGDLREANRFTLLGMIPAALLAASAVTWLWRHARLLAVGVLVLGVLEAGWPGNLPVTPPGQRISPVAAALPALDRPIAADHSRSIVVDAPFGLWGGTGLYGSWLAPQVLALALATEDGHPRAVAYVAAVPVPVSRAIQSHPFYADLVRSQNGQANSAAQLAAARGDAHRIGVGWVLLWWYIPSVALYLADTGFRFSYRCDGVSVYWNAGGLAVLSSLVRGVGLPQVKPDSRDVAQILGLQPADQGNGDVHHGGPVTRRARLARASR